jgi:UDP-glucose 4-epimerase
MCLLPADQGLIVGDVTDLPLILRTATKHEITHIIHLAAIIGAPSTTNPAKAFLINTIGTANIFEAALATGVERVCWASSVMAMGVNTDYAGEIVDETYNGRPTAAYGTSKYGAELISETYSELHGLNTVCIRPCLAFGIGREGIGAGFIADAVKALAQGRVATIYGHGFDHQPIYDKDMAALFIKGAFEPMPASHVFNTLVDANYSVHAMADLLRKMVPDGQVKVTMFDKAYLPPPIVTGARAGKELNFKPRYTLEAAFQEMLDFYRA